MSTPNSGYAPTRRQSCNAISPTAPSPWTATDSPIWICARRTPCRAMSPSTQKATSTSDRSSGSLCRLYSCEMATSLAADSGVTSQWVAWFAAADNTVADCHLIDLVAHSLHHADGGVAQPDRRKFRLLRRAGRSAPSDAIHLRTGADLREARAHQHLTGGRNRRLELFNLNLSRRGENQPLSHGHATIPSCLVSVTAIDRTTWSSVQSNAVGIQQGESVFTSFVQVLLGGRQ